MRVAECLRTYRGAMGNIDEVCFLRYGKQMVSCGDDRTIWVWDGRPHGRSPATLEIAVEFGGQMT